MSTPDVGRDSPIGLSKIEAEIVEHRAELVHTVDELSERINIKKRATHQWNHAKRTIGNSAAVAKDNFDLALVRAQFALPRPGATIITAMLGVLGCLILIVIVHRRKP
ncbi:DUF3618 domain-containing protein [Paeniglutamicibacter antarcticus]|uniref:DUF3618 domain-containing protein n=1 Tax=Paeniglutamicibacter antarcticus TaxID=494023 RepID=A0ABP9TTU3_9MICC